MLFADYLHTIGKKEGLRVAVIDADDMQNSISRKRSREDESKNAYTIMNISSKDLPERMETLKSVYDIILVDLPGNMKQEGVATVYYLIDVAFIPLEPSELDVDSSMLFYDTYRSIIEYRKNEGYKTSVYGIFNRVNPNLLEFKDLYAKKDNLAFPFLNSFVKESRVKYQRNISTTEEVNTNTEEMQVWEDVLEKITSHLNK